MLQILKYQWVQVIKGDELLQAKIAAAFGKRISTVQRWIKEGHIMLSHTTVLDIIREHKGLSEDVALTEEVETKAA